MHTGAKKELQNYCLTHSRLDGSQKLVLTSEKWEDQFEVYLNFSHPNTGREGGKLKEGRVCLHGNKITRDHCLNVGHERG